MKAFFKTRHERLRRLFLSLPWQELTPETNHHVATDGYGEGLGTAVTAHTGDHKLSVTGF